VHRIQSGRTGHSITSFLFFECTIWGGTTARFTNHSIKRIATLCREKAFPLQTVADRMKPQGIDYYQIYRFLRTEKGKELFAVEKSDGLIWVRTRPRTFDLIQESQNSNKAQNTEKHRRQILKNKKYGKCGPERYNAISKALRSIDIRPIAEEVEKHFNEYLKRTEDKKIILQPDPEQDLFGPLVELQYKTRFNDESRKVAEIDRYEKIFEKAAEQYGRAVMVTLTTDPKQQRSLWDGNKKISKNFNKLMSFLKRRLGYRPPYINVFEFQKNGRLHLHIILFGISYLINKKMLSGLWQKYEQGKIVDIISLKNDNGRFNWARAKPRDASDGETPADYLKKYVKKNLYDSEQSFQYWLYNTRFYTYSRVFSDPKPGKGPSFYIFVGVFSGISAGNMASRPGNSLGRATTEPPDPDPQERYKQETREFVNNARSGNMFQTAYEILNQEVNA